jgi:hypothetical protein
VADVSTTSFLPVYGLPNQAVAPTRPEGEWWVLVAYHPADVLAHGPSGWTVVDDAASDAYRGIGYVRTVWTWTSTRVPEPPIVFTSHACEAFAFVQMYRS